MSQQIDGRDESVGARPIGEPVKKRGLAAWLIPLLLVVAGVVILLLLLSQCGGSDSSSSGSTAAPGSAPASVTTSSVPSPTETAGGAGGGAGTITAEGQRVLPLTGGSSTSLSKYAGQKAVTTSVKVQSVPADEGFWVGTGRSNRVWVQLTGKAGESPYKVKTGDSVTFTGKIIKNASGFARTVGVTASEGRAQLDAQAYHIDAAKSSLKLAS